MTVLARINLADFSIQPDAAPWANVIMTTLPPSVWADLSVCGYPGIGYWPVITQTPAYNSSLQQLGAELLLVDKVNRQVIQTWAVVALPSAASAVTQNYVARLQGQAALLNRRGKTAAATALSLKAMEASQNG